MKLNILILLIIMYNLKREVNEYGK